MDNRHRYYASIKTLIMDFWTLSIDKLTDENIKKRWVDWLCRRMNGILFVYLSFPDRSLHAPPTQRTRTSGCREDTRPSHPSPPSPSLSSPPFPPPSPSCSPFSPFPTFCWEIRMKLLSLLIQDYVICMYICFNKANPVWALLPFFIIIGEITEWTQIWIKSVNFLQKTRSKKCSNAKNRWYKQACILNCNI